MKNRKSLWSVLLFICLLFSLSAVSSAEWKVVNGSRYYYKNNVKATGLQTISGKKYLFKSTGELVVSQVSSYKGKIYVSTSNGSLLTTWGKSNGKTYYGTTNGSVKIGLQKRGSDYYYFAPATGAMVKKVWVTIGKYRYFFQSSGKAVRNKIVSIDGKKYYFNAVGKLQKGIIRIGKYYYGFGSTTGKMLTGSVKYGKNYYYFYKSNGRAITNAWKTISGKKYYYNSDGRRYTGWLILGSKKYYLDPASKGAMVKGKKSIGGRTYDFGSKGYVTYNVSNNIVIRVNRKKCVVTIYDNGIPVKAMACSVGRSGADTPVGTFYIQDHLAWHVLDGPSWGQYCSHFLPSYLFHSVPMHSSARDPYKVEASNFNRLGTPASGGCIRLCIADAKWIYQNVPIGSTVIISDSQPTPLGKPTVVKMPKNSIGADPTDDFKNPAGYDVSIK